VLFVPQLELLDCGHDDLEPTILPHRISAECKIHDQ
jgi:hypothetical protein